MLRIIVTVALLITSRCTVAASDKGPLDKATLASAPKHHRVVMTIIEYPRPKHRVRK